MGPAAPFIAIAATVISTAVGVYGAVSTASAQADARKAQAAQQQQQLLNQQTQLNAQSAAQAQQQQQALYQARIAQNNASTEANNKLLAAKNAAYTEQAGAQQADLANLRTRALVGSQRASFAANGLLLNEGSPLDVTSGSETLGSMGVQSIRDDAARKAVGFRIAGLNAGQNEDAANVRIAAYDNSADYYGQASSASSVAAGRAGAAAAGVTYNSDVSGGYASAAGTLATGASNFSKQYDALPTIS